LILIWGKWTAEMTKDLSRGLGQCLEMLLHIREQQPELSSYADQTARSLAVRSGEVHWRKCSNAGNRVVIASVRPPVVASSVCIVSSLLSMLMVPGPEADMALFESIPFLPLNTR
jgi:hypothetical protein